MASLVLLLSELLKHHDAELGTYTSSSSSSSSSYSSFSGGLSCATAKRVTGKSLRPEVVVENEEAELRVSVQFV